MTFEFENLKFSIRCSNFLSHNSLNNQAYQLWHGVKAAGVKRVTAEKSLDRHERAFERPVTFDRFHRIFRTRRIIPACISGKRRGNESLINSNKGNDHRSSKSSFPTPSSEFVLHRFRPERRLESGAQALPASGETGKQFPRTRGVYPLGTAAGAC